MDIKRFSHVQHISSEIVGYMAEGSTTWFLLRWRSKLPAGTLTGAPKNWSDEIIDDLENDGRGPYGGAVGQFSFNGDCTLPIPIRTVFAKRATRPTCKPVGVTSYDFQCEDEYEENPTANSLFTKACVRQFRSNQTQKRIVREETNESLYYSTTMIPSLTTCISLLVKYWKRKKPWWNRTPLRLIVKT